MSNDRLCWRERFGRGESDISRESEQHGDDFIAYSKIYTIFTAENRIEILALFSDVKKIALVKNIYKSDLHNFYIGI